jgi:hypothetical protein
MKYAHTFDITKDDFPPFWDKDYYKIALKRLDSSRMSPLDRALLENTLMRIKTVADKNLQILEETKAKATETTKKEAIKKLLLMKLGTEAQIAEAQDVSIDFVKQVKKNLLTAQKRKAKKTKTDDLQ